MKTNRYIWCTMIASMVMCACSNENKSISVSSNNVSFRVGQTGTRVSLYGNEADFAADDQSFAVYSWDQSDTKVFDNVTVTKKDGEWVPAQQKVWRSGTTMTFEAVYPQNATGLTLTPNETPANMTFSYTVPTTAATQQDLMFAYYQGQGTNGVADLVFTHALTGIKFKIGDIKGVTAINSVTMAGVYASGSCTVRTTTDSSSKQCYSYETSAGESNWTPSGSQTVTANGSVTSFVKGTVLSDDFIFALIPQNLSTQNVTLTINVTGLTGEDKDISATLSAGTWHAGQTNMYTLSYDDHMGLTVTDNVVDDLKNNLVITNSGTAKAYFRATITANWYDANGNIAAFWDGSGTFEDLPGSAKWISDTDSGTGNTFYYYIDPVDSGDVIPDPLFTSYLAPSAPDGTSGLHLEMQILVQAVVYDASKTNVTEAWGSTIAAQLNN